MGSHQLSIATRDHIVKMVLKDLYAEKLTKMIKEAWKKVDTAYAKEWSKFPWKGVEPYRKYMSWRSSISFCDFFGDREGYGSRYSDNYSSLCHVLGTPSVWDFTLSKEYPCLGYCALPVSEAMKKKIIDTYTPVLDFMDKVMGFENEMRHTLASVNTTKQAADLIPEIVKYLPDEAAKAFVPVP